MSALAEYLLSVGVKGQNVVLAEIGKVKKQADALSKMKPTIDMGKGLLGKALGGKKVPGVGAPAGQPAPSPEQEKSDKQQEKSDKKQTENTKKFGKSATMVGGAMTKFASAASGLDPVTTMHGITNAASKIAGGWSVLGISAAGVASGLGELMNAGVSMASGAVNSAKQNAAAQYGLTTRNATTANYGGGNINQTAYATSKSDKGKSLAYMVMSNEEKANMVSTISGSFGKIQKPMADVLNKYVGSKDTGALTRVAAGDWQSTGTDKGWFLQQISNQFQGLPPSIAQAFQSKLLEQYGSEEIQNKTAEQKGAQATNAGWVSQNENQTSKLYAAAAQNIDALYKLSGSFNDIQIKLVNSGGALAGTVDKMASAVNAAVGKLQGGQVKK